MILSSSDILKILGADAIIRQEAKLAIVEGRPGIDTGDTVYIYIEKYPTIDEFEATWKIWVQDNSGMGEYVLNAMTALLPKFDFAGSNYTTTDFASERTVVKSQEEIDREEFQDRFSGLQKGLEDRLSAVRDGVDGKDGKDGLDGLPGKDGRDGRDGRDGKDLVATEAELFDLQDVEQGIQMSKGQVLTWDGDKWTNLYVRQARAFITGGGGADGAATLDDLADVTIDPALLEKDFGLLYDGTEWVVGSPPVLLEGHNRTGSTIPKGTPVYVAGTHNSGKPLFAPADADGAGTHPAIGLLHEDMEDGVDGHVMLSGLLTNLDTSSYSAGDALYLSTAAGALTNVRPTAATEKVQKVGLVTRVHANAGSVLIIGAGRTNDINNELVALLGAGDRNAVDMGTFTGNVISDNVDVKVALQELETAVESAAGGGVLEAPLDGQAYVRQSGGWQPTTTASISYNLSQNQLADLGDTTITAAAAGEALIWNGSAWVNGGDLSGGSF